MGESNADLMKMLAGFIELYRFDLWRYASRMLPDREAEQAVKDIEAHLKTLAESGHLSGGT